MKYSLLFELLEEARLSHEQLGARLGLSGMTLRRWQEEDREKPLPRLYELALRDTVHQLLVDGKLSPASPLVQKVFEETTDLTFQAALKNLGFSGDFFKSAETKPENLMTGLAQIATDEKKKEEVDRNEKKILSFKKMGKEWKERISVLLKVIKSKKLTSFDKLVAYGALIYLITVFDLVPDTIPFFGLLDDFGIMGLVVAYYLNRYPKSL
ncbi:MAG: DUF1232 domain-containing protein [bacterium]